MKRIPFKICILLVVILSLGLILLGVYKTDSLIITDLDKQKKINKIIDHYDFKWGPTDHTLKKIKQEESNNNNNVDSNNIGFSSTSRNIRSSAEDDNSNSNNVILEKKQCDSTVQGSLYIADDQGFVCLRSHWDSDTKCCLKQPATTIPQTTSSDSKPSTSTSTSSSSIEDLTTERYSCKRCLGSGGNSGILDCCDSYEFCISCCMRQDKISILYDSLIDFAQKGLGKQYLKNQFDLCSMVCRTSSSSLLNQREYQNPNHKFCFSFIPQQQQPQQPQQQSNSPTVKHQTTTV